MNWTFFIQGGILFTLVTVISILVMKRFVFDSVDGAKQRLDREAEAARKREAELNQKIKEADAELHRRQKELDVMEKKMRQELEESASKQKEELIQKARQEAEDIITKAQNTREALRREIEKNMEIKIVDYSVRIINEVFTNNSKDSLDRQLFTEFIEKLKAVDLTKLGPDVVAVDLISANPLWQEGMTQVATVFKDKMGREIKINPKIDKAVLGGVILQFDTLMLDGSLQSSFKESANAIKAAIEKQYAA